MSWSALLLLALVGTLLWLALNACCLAWNCLKARQLELPIVVQFVNPLNVFWVLFSQRIMPLIDALPWGLPHFFHYTDIGWEFKDKYFTHEKLGDAFVVVHPFQMMVYIADASAIDDIASRRKDFTKSEEFYKPLELFGPNVDTVEGVTWQRHRKITTPPFNERNSGLVWKESLRQAHDMIESWSAHGEDGVSSTSADTMTLALHVLTSAGFGQSYSFHAGSTTLPPGHKMSYRDALALMLKNFVVIIVFNQRFLMQSFLPKKLREIGLATQEFKTYMAEMVAMERHQISKRDPGSGNLISSLVRASEEGKAASASLSDEEIMGNLFIYNLAGHETTANTLAFAISLLSISPDIQDWLHSELSSVLGSQAQDAWNYESAFPRLPRCLAILYETIRLYGPVVSIAKYAKSSPQPLTIAGKHYSIPQHTYVAMNIIAVHTRPKYWGPDSLSWNPKRWILDDASTGGNETLKDPPERGAYKPWAEGPRVCPGKKFAQVEFVAVLATLFREWTVRPKLLVGESAEEARVRVRGVVDDSRVYLTLKMQRPGSVGLVWTRRGW